MAFSSNWSQPTNSNHQHHHHEHQLHENGSIVSGHGLLSHQLPPLQANPNPNHHHHVAASGGLPARMGGSMAERARQAKIHPPEGPIKCPRCDSSNTKFCYYNNYNLTQPRHFCKGCRRYWTQGGALRNVPVGGGCRKNNKKGKNGTSKSSSSSSKQSLTVNAPSPSSGQLRTNHQFPFSPTLYNLTQLGGIGLNLAANNGNNQTHQIGSSLMNDLGFLHVGNGRNTTAQITGNIHDNNNNNNNNNNNENNLMTSVGSLSHFALFDPTTGLYAFQNEGNIGNNVEVSCSSTSMVDSRVYQAPPVKMEEQPNLANLTRPVSGLTSPENQTNQYFWAGSDFSGPSNELL